jgi:hypothetical protein
MSSRATRHAHRTMAVTVVAAALLAGCSGGSGSASAVAPTPTAAGGQAVGSATGSAAVTGVATVRASAPPSAKASPTPSRSANLAGSRKPGCNAPLFSQKTGLALGAVTVYLTRPEAKKAFVGTGTAASVARLRGGQAARFAQVNLAAARAAVRVCGTAASRLGVDLGKAVLAAHTLAGVLAAGHAPSPAQVGALNAADSVAVADAKALGITVTPASPTLQQIASGQ